MDYQLLDITKHRFTNHFLNDSYILSNNIQNYTYGCVPNGEIGISIILRGESYTKKNESWIKQPIISVYGLVQQIQFHKMSAGYCEINIGFKPEMLQLFLKERISNLLKREATDLYDLLPGMEVDKLYEEMKLSNNTDEVLAGIESFLKRNLIFEKTDSRIQYAMKLMGETENRSVKKISAELGISSSRLRNLFREYVGIAPKDLIKIYRLQSVLKSGLSSIESQTQLAYANGYFDQAHFIHEFKEAIGITPKKYFQNKKLTFDFYNFQRWGYDSFV